MLQALLDQEDVPVLQFAQRDRLSAFLFERDFPHDLNVPENVADDMVRTVLLLDPRFAIAEKIEVGIRIDAFPNGTQIAEVFGRVSVISVKEQGAFLVKRNWKKKSYL